MKSTKKKPKESLVALGAVNYLNNLGFETYCEVEAGPGIADIVAVKNKIIWVVEAKVNFGLAVIDQAIRWKSWANMVSVVVYGRSWARTPAGQAALKSTGVGLFEMPFVGREDLAVSRLIPELRRSHNGKMFEKLHPEQKMSIPGSQAGQVFTPFKVTVFRLKEIVAQNPGIRLSDAIKGIKNEQLGIKHHYSTDKSAIRCLKDLLVSGVIKGIRFEPEHMNLFIEA